MKKVPNKTDLRVVKSEAAIRDAFWKLAEDEGFPAITVSRIVGLAVINRSTFYDHYKDKYDLRDRLREELFEEVRSIASSAPISAIDDHSATALRPFEQYLGHVLRFFEDNEARITLLYQDDQTAFRKDVEDTIRLIWDDHRLSDRFIIPTHYAVVALSSLTAGLIGEWFASGKPELPEEFAHIAAKVVLPLPQHLLRQR